MSRCHIIQGKYDSCNLVWYIAIRIRWKVFYAVKYSMWRVFPLHFTVSGGSVCRNTTNSSHLPSDRGISRAFSESLDMAEHGTVKKPAENGVKVASFDPQEEKNMAILRERTSRIPLVNSRSCSLSASRSLWNLLNHLALPYSWKCFFFIW